MSSSRAITLLEILTVLAILMLLAALTYPVYVQARFKGREPVCISNMRQLASAFQMYRQDYDGREAGTLDTELGLPPGSPLSILMNTGYLTDFTRGAEGKFIAGSSMQCPNRYVDPMWADTEWKDHNTYATYATFGPNRFASKYSKDTLWPVVACPYHDLHWVKPGRKTGQVSSTIFLGVALNGTLTRRALSDPKIWEQN